jgi:hypothetical protein
MSRGSVRQQRSAKERSSPTTSEHRVTSGVLNQIHVDSTNLNNNIPDESSRNLRRDLKGRKYENEERLAWSPHHVLGQSQYQYQYRYRYNEKETDRDEPKSSQEMPASAPPQKREPRPLPIDQSTLKPGRVIQRGWTIA